MQSAITEVQLIIEGLTEAFEPCADEARPGARVIDIYPKQIEFLDWKIEDSLRDDEEPGDNGSEPDRLGEETEGNLPEQKGQHVGADISVPRNSN